MTRTIQTSGIYRIRNTVNNRAYYGSSVNMHQRWLRHRTDLIPLGRRAFLERRGVLHA